jgi:hypothetical protein
MNNRKIGGRLQEIRLIRRLSPLGFAFVCLASMTACNRNGHVISEPQMLAVASAPMRTDLAQASGNPSARGTLSREHSVTIEVSQAFSA